MIILSWIKMQTFAAFTCSLVLTWGVCSEFQGVLQMKRLSQSLQRELPRLLFRYHDHEAVKVDDLRLEPCHSAEQSARLTSETIGDESFVRQLGVDCDTLAQLLADFSERDRECQDIPYGMKFI